MLLDENQFHSISRRAMRLGIVAAAALTAVPQEQSLAHTVLLSRGTVVVHPNHIVTRIEIDAKDFIHYYHLRSTAEGFPPQRSETPSSNTGNTCSSTSSFGTLAASACAANVWTWNGANPQNRRSATLSWERFVSPMCWST